MERRAGQEERKLCSSLRAPRNGVQHVLAFNGCYSGTALAFPRRPIAMRAAGMENHTYCRLAQTCSLYLKFPY